ncbi:OmpA/MotB family protein [Sinomicrobium weinanense]|uniref:Flagellar motor protein MotB n=1 Tax=Sinomicrobium weinanense TaxID=2842200 RepID=A0A926Q3E4_9FLAO|nr:OmpA family protein [Sinomicrobium weinanense]MBC9797527.1 flagellar motor protein MotB [Sinomicrobium weinanense]MBU3122386.1 OmpA family protein [Sinomicrobium weinanense]
MKKAIIATVLGSVVLTSCVSKKKYVALEEDLSNTRSTLQKTTMEKEELEDKFAKIEARVAEYNAKINSLREDNDEKLVQVGDLAVMSNNTKEKMRATLAKVDPAELAKAETLEDSINLAISYNVKNSITDDSNDEDIDINVDKTVVMINISDKLLFRSGSYHVNRKAYGLLEKLAQVINSEPSMDVMVEGHTDSQTVKEGAYIKDNWELSVERSTSIIRLLQNKFGVNPKQLIAAGRGSNMPLVDNDTPENRAKNRRTRIVIIPNLDKFFALLES